MMAYGPHLDDTQMGPSRRRECATLSGATFRQSSSPTLPPDLEDEDYYTLEGPAPNALDQGLNSDGGPGEACLHGQWNREEKFWDVATQFPGCMDYVGGIAQDMAPNSNYSDSPTMGTFAEENPMSSSQDLHWIHEYSHQTQQPSSSAEIPRNSVETSNSEVACKSVSATKRPGAFDIWPDEIYSAQLRDPPLVFNFHRNHPDPLPWGSESPYLQVKSPASRHPLTGTLEREVFNNPAQQLSSPGLRPSTPQNVLGRPQPPGTLDAESDLPGTSCFHMKPDQDIVKPRKKRRYTDTEKQRIKNVREAKACVDCRRQKRKCMHVALDDSTVSGTRSQAKRSTSTGMPNMPQDAGHETPEPPELLHAIEDSQEASPNGDYPDPRTPASQDSGNVRLADLTQGIDTQSFVNFGPGNPWAEFLPFGTGPADHELNPIQWR